MKTKLHKLKNGMQFWIRPRTSDLSTVIAVAQNKEYQKYFDIKPNDVVIDIGANIGAFACSVAYEEPTAQVYAFEPLTLHFNFLRANIFKNKLGNIKAYNYAIDKDTRIVDIFYEDKWSAAASLYDSYFYEKREYKTEKVMTISLKEIFEECKIKKCNFLKIDCEGAEYKFLMNTPLSIFKKIDKIAMEFHDYDDKYNFLDLIKLFEKVGYKIIIPKVYSFTTLEGKEKQIGMLYAWREKNDS